MAKILRSQQEILDQAYYYEGQGLTTSPLSGLVNKNITFDGTANKGATGNIPLFSVSGDVMLTVLAVCPTGGGLAGAAATHKISTDFGDIVQVVTTATTVVAGKVLDKAGLVTSGVQPAQTPVFYNGNAQTVFATVAVAAITGGTLRYYCLWQALSPDAAVTAL